MSVQGILLNDKACESDGCLKLSEREMTVCQIVCSSNGPIAFGRLKETSQLHQEKLSRVLKRLAFYGCIYKVHSGWQSACCQ